jgi:hypothetical protein
MHEIYVVTASKFVRLSWDCGSRVMQKGGLLVECLVVSTSVVVVVGQAEPGMLLCQEVLPQASPISRRADRNFETRDEVEPQSRTLRKTLGLRGWVPQRSAGSAVEGTPGTLEPNLEH